MKFSKEYPKGYNEVNDILKQYFGDDTFTFPVEKILKLFKQPILSEPSEPISNNTILSDVVVQYPELNKVYRHYKGGLYEVISMSTHTETGEVLVIYKSLLFGTVYARPLTLWFNEIEIKDVSLKFKNKVTRFKLA